MQKDIARSGYITQTQRTIKAIVLATALLVLPLRAEEAKQAPEKLSDSEQVAFLREQLAVVVAQRDMAKSLASYYENEKAVSAAMENASKKIQALQNAKCTGCQIDAEKMVWVKPSAPEVKKK